MMTMTPKISDFVLYAERSLSLGEHDKVSRGAIGVHAIATPSSSFQLNVGRHSVIDPGYTVYAPSVSLGEDVKVGTIQTNRLQANGQPLGAPEAFPATVMPPLPLAPAPTVSGSSVVIEANEVVALPPGNYDALTVRGTLELNPGQYSFSSALLADHSHVAVAGTVHISILDRLTVGQHVQINPDFREGADQLIISISGVDTTGGPPAVFLGAHSTIRALLAAPHGSLSFADHVHATGAFAGFDIAAGEEVEIDFESGFPADAPDQHGSQQLQGYYSVHPDPHVAPLAGPVPADRIIGLAVGLPVRDLDGLTTFIKHVSDPKDPNFRKYITQAQFYATYGATDADYHSLQDWANAQGFTIKATFPNNLLLSVRGTAAQIEQALFVNLVYRLRMDGSKFVAVDREPSLNLTVPISHISGLTDFVLPHRENVSGTGGNPGAPLYRAADLRNAYLGVGSGLQSLDGKGQVVGIVSYESINPADIAQYNTLQRPVVGQPSPLPQPNVSIVDVGGGPHPATSEAALDVEMVLAMAPNAQILHFEGSNTDIWEGFHLDDIFMAMACSTPQLTVASCSYSFGRSPTEQYALDQMAATSVSFFASSGDYGDIGDPQNNKDMDHQTLVGGTFLSTNALIPPLASYPIPYYASEATWNGQQPAESNDVTGGGVMDGNNYRDNTNFGQIGVSVPGCYCWPYPYCCGDGVPIPDYQVGVMQISAATNRGSTQWRNYPDVAMVAANIEIVFNGQPTPDGGTSAAAPLWAGFMALVNQAILNGNPNAGPAGWINPTLYDIGETRGGDVDLYTLCFNDIQDYISNYNGFGKGFQSVPGYDLTTGLGTPKPGLVFQLSSSTPLAKNQPMSNIRFEILTGHDDLRGNGGIGSGCTGSGATADVFLPSGGSFTVRLKDTNTDEEFAENSTFTHDAPIPATDNNNNPIIPLTPAQGITGVRINMEEGDYVAPCTADNWDIASLYVWLFVPPFSDSHSVCQLKLIGESQLEDGSSGLVRLSQSAPSSPIFTTGPGSGCP